MIKRLLLVLASASVLLLNTARAENSPDTDLVLLTENFPPYNMAKDGKNFAKGENINGIATDIVREMFKRAGLTYSLTLRFPLGAGLQTGVGKPRLWRFRDGASAGSRESIQMGRPDRSRRLDHVGKSRQQITLETLNDARKYKIGAYKGDAIAETLTRQGLQPLVVLRDQDNAKKLVNGQIDLWATGDPAGRYLARQDGVTGLKTVLRFNSAELYLALNKDVADTVVAKLQAALDQMRKDGVVDEIMSRYL